MAATVTIFRSTGAGPTATDITTINTRIKADDTHSTAGADNPIRVPDSGVNYSFWAPMRMRVTENAETNTINNMKFYTDGSSGFGTGMVLQVAVASAYDQAVGTVGTSGSAISGNYTGLINSAVSAAFDYTQGAPLDINTSSTGTAATGDIGDFVVLQFQVSSNAGAGASNSETMSYQYDES